MLPLILSPILAQRVQKVFAMRHNLGARHLSFIQLLHDAKAEIKPFDPWEEQVHRLRGEVGSDGVERISTEGIFDALDLPAFQRTAPIQLREAIGVALVDAVATDEFLNTPIEALWARMLGLEEGTLRNEPKERGAGGACQNSSRDRPASLR
jgi:hypothetical protein